MSDISVALERIRSLERAVQTPYSGDAMAFMQVLSGHLGTDGADGATSSAAGTTQAAEASGADTDLDASDLLLLDGVARSRFLRGGSSSSSAVGALGAMGTAGLTALSGTMAPALGTGSERLLRPVSGPVSSPFGERVHPVTGQHKHHDGVDLAAAEGMPIRAAEEGVVSFAGQQGGYGNVVIVDHAGPGGSFQTVYAHQSRIGVTAGEHVARGEVIGAVGSTGVTTGPHLHFEVRQGGKAVDPLPYL